MKSSPVAALDARKASPWRFFDRKRIRLVWIALLALLFLAWGMQHSVEAADSVFIVNATGDEPDSVISDGICETAKGNGRCTLRAAIQEANAELTDTTITFNIPETDPGYNGISWTIDLLTALPDLSTSVAILGPGADLLTVTRNSDTLFRIFNVTSAVTIKIFGLTVSNGESYLAYGGGISNETGGTVNVTNCTLSGNVAYNSDGGAINNKSTGIVNVTNCSLIHNVAQFGNGGGVSNEGSGTVFLLNRTLSGNAAGGRGGGITNQSTGTVNVTNSTINGNSAGGGGGGITNQSSGTINVTNSSVNENGGADDGGIRQVGLGTVNVTNSTISGNFGEGLSNHDGAGVFNVKSSIVALNVSGPEVATDVSGTFNSAGFNLIGATDGSTGFTLPTDQTGTMALPLDPKLDSNGLQDNGGPTQTIPLLPSSPAIDKGTSEGLTGSLITDQRGAGFPRVFDDPAVPNAMGGDGTDIGASEFHAGLPPPTPAAKSLNISTRLGVGTGDDVLIGGFIITGNAPKMVLLRAIGPSLANANPPVAGALADPVLELHEPDGTVVINDNWKDSQEQAITDTGIPPGNDLESAILETLAPGPYTAIMSGSNNGTGVALIEAYDLETGSDSKLANISSRGKVDSGDDVIIGGFILGPDGLPDARVVVRAIGPSLIEAGVTGALLDPTLELHDSSGNLMASDDNWRDDSAQEAELEADGLAPTDDRESAIDTTLAPGAYTAIVGGKDGLSGIGLVEVYNLE